MWVDSAKTTHAQLNLNFREKVNICFIVSTSLTLHRHTWKSAKVGWDTLRTENRSLLT